jgi:hypothetical protein
MPRQRLVEGGEAGLVSGAFLMLKLPRARAFFIFNILYFNPKKTKSLQCIEDRKA